MSITGTISYTFTGDNIDVKKIHQNLNVLDSTYIEKGHVVQSGHIARTNVWDFSMDFNKENFNDVLEKHLKIIASRMDVINNLNIFVSWVYVVFFQSNEAQISLKIHKTNINMLSDLKIDLQISVLSWGLVYDKLGVEHNINDLIKE